VISLQARAKLNLSLAVLAKRPDGFHEIESLMVPVTLHDTLTIRTSDDSDVRLTVRFGGRMLRPEAAVLRRDVPTDDSNLVVRAARLLAADAGETRGLEIDLVKEIPSGAGLGGGSSDAAAALVGAARAWGIDWSRARLATLAAQLGSDVPFFLEGGPAIASGRGERLMPVVRMPALDAVIACPAPGLSTAAVYTHCTPDPTQRGAAERLAASFVAGDLPAALGGMHNTLEPPARGLCTEVGRLLAALAAAGAVRPMLTGSGSACFAVVRSAAEARAIAARLEAAGWPGVFAVRLASDAAV
jgi:4-diphosphocytidyl-2-C-methyl-D-erythritol kinase